MDPIQTRSGVKRANDTTYDLRGRAGGNRAPALNYCCTPLEADSRISSKSVKAVYNDVNNLEVMCNGCNSSSGGKGIG